MSLRLVATVVEDQDFIFYAFNACKPTFYMDEGKLAVTFEEKNKGFGCFLGCDMSVSG